jgi:molybdopterin/thiamine biosynthesis adenylyltransferase/rhodanese-related sulfurtransferase
MSNEIGLTKPEVYRYSRHLILPEVGVEGQQKLKAASVLLVGAGGLGSPIALYLAAAGIGHIGIVDFDVVDESNLQRQINPHVDVTTYETRLTSANALEILRGYDIVIDGTDNFATRYLTNDACVLLGIPNVYGSIYRFEGQVSVFATAEGPCYRCLFREPPPPGLVPSCAEGGVLGVLPGTIGTLQATEAIKLLLGIGQPLIGRLLLYDALTLRFRTLNLRKDPSCPACGTRTIRELIDYDQFCGVTAEPTADEVPEIAPRELAARLQRGDDLDLIDVREINEWEFARISSARLVPLATLPNAFSSIDPERDVIVHCKSGARSAKAVKQLRSAGFRRVWNLSGGIQRWSQEVDPSVPRY